MGERIAIREAARRLGVSDTAVRKAIQAGRVTVAGNDPNNGRPLLEWPAVQDQWQRNSDSSKRSHVGSVPGSKRGKDAAAQGAKPVQLPTSGAGGDNRQAMPAADDTSAGGKGPSYAQSRAIRELYAAKLAKLEYDEKLGKLVSADQLKVEAFKVHRRVRDAILNIPDRCSPHLASLTDPADVHAYLLGEINAALRQLAGDIYAPAQ